MPRYVLKPDPHSSHSVILKWLGEGRGRRILDVGAADGIVSRRLTERGWRVTGVEGDPALALVGARYCERMLTANLNREIPEVAGPFDAILYGHAGAALPDLTDELAQAVGRRDARGQRGHRAQPSAPARLPVHRARAAEGRRARSGEWLKRPAFPRSWW